MAQLPAPVVNRQSEKVFQRAKGTRDTTAQLPAPVLNRQSGKDPQRD